MGTKYGPSADQKEREAATAHRAVDEYTNLRNKIDEGKRANGREVVDWVFNMIGTNPSEIDPLSVPERGAVMLLRHVERSPLAYDSLLELWKALLPSRSTLDVDAKFSDDGHKLLQLLDQFDKEAEDSQASLRKKDSQSRIRP